MVQKNELALMRQQMAQLQEQLLRQSKIQADTLAILAANKGKVKAPAKTITAVNSYDGEPVVNKVKVAGTRVTKAQNGLMVNFNSSQGKKNYCLFVKNAWKDKIKFGKEFTVTEHIGKTSGKISHAIHIGRKACVYGSAK